MTITTQSPLATRKQLAAHVGLSLRTIDDLLSKALLPHFRIGTKSIRFDVAEVEAALRERFHVNAKAGKPAKGSAS
ncbi:helix-turn-helix transcriptional regulator [Prosthecobacter sp.]|jgi:predicted DNA-binding transcriptional regulator AlpA|uniref:helix-turn-helix transcriptional regulator n=1 Tax=Prosthecobacter sp. TaxID=1965333 RepID=UPI00378404F7